MRNGYLALVLTLFGLPTYACSDFAVYSSTRDDGTELGLFLSKEIASTASWVPQGDEPPLSLGSAMTTALAWGKQTYTRFDSVEIESISLQRYGCSELHDKWYYIVNFRPYIDGAAIYSSGHFAAVLMNGQVIAPRVSKQSRPR
jgi:hypothetical protein